MKAPGVPESRKRSLAIIGQQLTHEYLRADLAMDAVLAQAEPSCTKGCAHCCKMLILISAEEALAIAATYPHKLRAKRKQLLAQVEKLKPHYAKTFGDNPDTELASTEDLDDYTKKNDALCTLWWEENEACVFLRPDNTCSVYAVRPVACRTYFVTSDPALCGAPSGTKVDVLDLGVGHALRGRIMSHADVVSFAYAPVQLLSALAILDNE